MSDDPYKAPTGPPPTYAGQHQQQGPYYPTSPSPGPNSYNQITQYQQFPQDVQPQYYNNQGPPPQGYYAQQQPMYYQQGPPQGPQGYFADNRGYGGGYGGGGGYGYQQQPYRGGSAAEGICAGLLGALACCCCLDCLF